GASRRRRLRTGGGHPGRGRGGAHRAADLDRRLRLRGGAVARAAAVRTGPERRRRVLLATAGVTGLALAAAAVAATAGSAAVPATAGSAAAPADRRSNGCRPGPRAERSTGPGLRPAPSTGVALWTETSLCK